MDTLRRAMHGFIMVDENFRLLPSEKSKHPSLKLLLLLLGSTGIFRLRLDNPTRSSDFQLRKHFDSDRVIKLDRELGGPIRCEAGVSGCV